jgi:hypothetical protein
VRLLKLDCSEQYWKLYGEIIQYKVPSSSYTLKCEYRKITGLYGQMVENAFVPDIATL